MTVASTACVYDSSDRCGPAMVFVEALNACECIPTAIPVVGGCQPCPSGQVAKDGKCEAQGLGDAVPAASDGTESAQ